MAFELLTYELFPGRTLHAAFFKDVANSAALRQALLNQETDIALINASLLVDPFQIHAAAARALLCETTTKLTTKTLHAELVFNLSGSRNVSESFRRFGIADDCTALVVCVFDADEAALASAAALVQGTAVPFSELGQHLTPADVKAVRKFYKIQDLELSTSLLSDAIVNRIATKSCNK
ncbi:hypothetical protein PybrP1_000964 [[Pythium] brassicae (nom. inval.)]|nr:hypothetical protein PybrP1_000964 [[Pythium] brassicae (nom. inval.)]